MTAIVATLTAVVALLTVLVAGLLRSHAEILRHLHKLGAGLEAGSDGATGATTPAHATPVGPPPANRSIAGDAAPDLVGSDLSADALSIAVSGRNHRTLLAFLSGGCTTCRPFWEAFSNPDSVELPRDLRVVVVTHDESNESPSTVAALAGEATVVMSSRAWSDYQVPGAPYFVLVADDRVSGEGTGVSWEQVRRLLGEATGDAALAFEAHGRRVDLTEGANEREARIDRALLSAGIHPGHASLYDPAGGAE